jgi:hypothetical protein
LMSRRHRRGHTAGSRFKSWCKMTNNTAKTTYVGMHRGVGKECRCPHGACPDVGLTGPSGRRRCARGGEELQVAMPAQLRIYTRLTKVWQSLGILGVTIIGGATNAVADRRARPESLTFLSQSQSAIATGGGLVEGCDVRGPPCLGLEFGCWHFFRLLLHSSLSATQTTPTLPKVRSGVGTRPPPSHRLTKSQYSGNER